MNVCNSGFTLMWQKKRSSETSDRDFVPYFPAINGDKLREILWRLDFCRSLPVCDYLLSMTRSHFQTPEQIIREQQ